MAYDLIIKNGTIVDGTGSTPYLADIAVAGGRIIAIGKGIRETGPHTIDASGCIVTPGFIDAHTHMDAQVFWDPLGTCSSWHGVTSVVMGNCGFTLAPTRPESPDLVLNNLERAEDIPRGAMEVGIDWRWESFPEFLDAVEEEPKAINYAAQVGHCALRTYAMGERAYTEEASSEDLDLMARVLEEAMQAGAAGFSTTASENHFTPDGRPVASRAASRSEIVRLVGVLGAAGKGVFQLTPPRQPAGTTDPEAIKEEWVFLRDLSVTTGVPITYGLNPRFLDFQLANFSAAKDMGGSLFGLSRSCPQSLILSFKSDMPYDGLPLWKEFRSRPLADQLSGLRDPAVRASLVEAVDCAYAGDVVVSISKQRPAALPSFDVLDVLREGYPTESVASLAKRQGVSPITLMIDLAVGTELAQVFGRFTGWTDEDLLKAMKDPNSVMTFSDSGAHVGHHSGAELHTLLLSKWVRDRGAFAIEEAVKMMTSVPARYWGFGDRGLLQEGMRADLNVIDLMTVRSSAPTIETDLPGGAHRVVQRATGYVATVVNGVQTFQHGEATGMFPGKLLRS